MKNRTLAFVVTLGGMGGGIAEGGLQMGDIHIYPSVLSWLVGTLFCIVGWFAIRTLKQIDRNQTTLSEGLESFKMDIYHRVNSLANEFNELKGEHNMAMRSGGHHRGISQLVQDQEDHP
jgi:hypothetical protein